MRRVKNKVIACIFLYNEDGLKCGFFDDGEELTLPSIDLDNSEFCAEAAIKLIGQCIDENLLHFNIVPFGFFDPINENRRGIEREIYLCYKTNIMPGTAVLKELKFLDFDDVRMARNRIKLGHYIAYKMGMN